MWKIGLAGLLLAIGACTEEAPAERWELLRGEGPIGAPVELVPAGDALAEFAAAGAIELPGFTTLVAQGLPGEPRFLTDLQVQVLSGPCRVTRLDVCESFACRAEIAQDALGRCVLRLDAAAGEALAPRCWVRSKTEGGVGVTEEDFALRAATVDADGAALHACLDAL